MIFKRLYAKLRAQDWMAIGIEFAIVVAGVFVGTWVANWNQDRLSRNETRHLLVQLRPEIDRIIESADNTFDYYATAHRFANQAFKGWKKDPQVSDRQFVIAAYQASQIHGLNSSPSWSLVFGGDQLRNIDDQRIREPLARLMTFNVEIMNENMVATPYRSDVRKVIPDELQMAIRNACGDELNAAASDFSLPEKCDVALDPQAASAAARALRSHPELVDELRSHLGIISGFLNQVRQYGQLAENLKRRLPTSDTTT